MPEATATPIPSVTYTPTPGPTPTETPTPFAPPTIRIFAVDRSPILFGESVTLVWDVADSTRVMLRYPGGEEEVAAQGNRVVSPDKSTQYSLFAASPVGQSEAAVTVEVNPLISAPTADLAAANDAVPAADAETATWTPTSVPVDTPTPVFTQMPIPTETSTETSTETPLPPQPATDTPVVEQRQALVAQADSPLIVTIVVTPEGAAMAQAPTAPAVVVLEPVGVGAARSDNGSTDAVNGAGRAFMVGGLVFVVGTPLLFAAFGCSCGSCGSGNDG